MAAMELLYWALGVGLAFALVLWFFLRPSRSKRLERDKHLPLEGDEHESD